MTRRAAVRVLLFERARLIGSDGRVRCAIIELSAVGAQLTLTARLPRPPLRLEFEVGDEVLTLAVEVQRGRAGVPVAVAFQDPPAEQLHHLIATEQRLALAAGRLNVRERRSGRRGARGEILPRPKRRSPDRTLTGTMFAR